MSGYRDSEALSGWRQLRLILCVLVACSAGCGDNLSPAPRTIGDHIRSDKRFSSLEGLLGDAELLAALDGPGPHTLFAPTDDAFTALLADPGVPSRDWLALPKLAELLRYHLHEGTLATDDLERVTAIATLEGPEIHVRLTLDGLVLNDGVKLDSEAIIADNGIIHVLDEVLVRPLITTTERYESAPGMSLATDGGFAFFSDYRIITNSDPVHDLRVILDIEHPDVSQLYVYIANRQSGAVIELVTAPASSLDDIDIIFADSAAADVVDDVAFSDDPEGKAFPQQSYRPIVPLENMLGESLEGEWELNIFDFRQDPAEDGRLHRWGFIATTGPELPAPAIVFNRRGLTDRVFGRGFTETVNVVANRVGGLTGDMELAGNLSELAAEPRTLDSEDVFASLLFPIPRDAETAFHPAEVSARIGDVSRVVRFVTSVVEPDASGVELLAHVPLPVLGAEGYEGNDIWGWTDPETGAEIALMGTSVGTTFVDITTPEAPIVLGALPTATGPSDWRDIKVYQDHAFIVSEAEDHGLQVFDLRRLRGQTAPQTFTASAYTDVFGNAHNIAINEDTGFAYVVGSNYPDCAGGLLMFDISTPLSPIVTGCFAGGVPNGAPAGPEYPLDVYIHDVQCVIYAGPDLEHQGREVCVSSDEQTLGIVDVSDKASPAQLSRVTYPGVGYTHQGWLTEDHEYFFLNDEFDEIDSSLHTRSYVWDVRDLDAPVLVGSVDNPRDAVGHNTYIKDDTAFQANYTSGLRLMDISGIATATGVESAYYDTYPDDDLEDGRPGTSMRCASQPHPHPDGEGASADSGCGVASFRGAWSNYPYFASGVIIVSDIDRGLFVLRAN